MNDDNPCTPDCPERNATCHATCPRYAKFVIKNERRRNQRTQIVEKENAIRRARYESWMKSVRKHGKP